MKRSSLTPLAALLMGLIWPAILQAVETKPNVLLILVDDLKPALGCYGDPHAKTPHMDALAARGMRFDLAYCNQAVCAPSRFTLMLGSHSTSTGLYDLGSNLRKSIPDAVTMPQHFAKHGGYHTESLGKVFHIGHGNHGDPQSFAAPHFKDKVIEYLDPASKPDGKLTREEAMFQNKPTPEGTNNLPRGAAFESPDVADNAYADGRVADETVRRLKTAKERHVKEGTPFFITAGFARPHLPFSAPKKYWDLYDPTTLPLATHQELPANSPRVAHKRGGEIRNYFPVPDKDKPDVKIDQTLARQLVHGYYASTSYTDAQIGKVIAALDNLDLANNTIVVLWGDHGFHLGDLGIWTKHTNYEQANRIPILITAPGATTPNTTTQQLAESVDIFPTLAELAGLPKPKGPQPIDGVSLVPVLKDPAKRVRDHAFHAYPKAKLGRAIRTERYRLVEWGDDYELYDYQNDPLETKNHAPDNPQVVAQLKVILASYPAPVDHRKQQASTTSPPDKTLADAPVPDKGFDALPGIPKATIAPVTKVMTRAEIESGLQAHDRALFIKNDWIRDPYITRGPDDFYYLTGTTINEDDPREETDPYNIGLQGHSAVGNTVRIWRSKDLIDWQDLGTPYTLEDSHHDDPGKHIWAPEVHWISAMNRWALVHCPKQTSVFALSAGPELKGPWSHPLGKNHQPKHDPSLYQDGDTWWMLSENTNIQPFATDFSRFTAPATRIDPSNSRTGPDGNTISRIGHEGATMIKVGKKYVHLGTAWSTDRMRTGSYNLYYSTADKITGPYGPRKFAGRFLGHGTPFQTRDGNWWCTAFFNANVPPLPRDGIRTRDLSETAQTINGRGTTIVPLDVRVLDDGEIFIRAKDPDYANPGPDEAETFAARSTPKVWIYTDMSDKTLPGSNKEGTLNDPDDISAMAGYLLMANEFETLGVVVASTHRREHAQTPDQGAWARQTFGQAYATALPGLRKHFDGYPDTIPFIQSCIKESAELYDPAKMYRSLDRYDTVRTLLELVTDAEEIINVLCWGSLTEPAILVNHCLATGQEDSLAKLRFIAHWTDSSLRQGSIKHPENVANCREDAKACAYLKEKALEGTIVYHECGAIGQHGIVSGQPKGERYFDQFRASPLGELFATGKFAHEGVDHSDSATYWVLLGEWGVDLKAIAPNGTNPTEIERANEAAFRAHSERIHSELLRRAQAAATPTP